ncbi:DDE-type integrase/transposase/recombinase [Streptomyces sp. NPDC087851]|uniref:DDE-type integrase/transposase/recombinase n=1 Tax=Streptomyces sp. NPDC087851 TaxID=3365810 RepID=UPI003803518C
MRANGLEGVIRSWHRRTTVPEPAAVRPPDLVNRRFAAARPNRLWVVDLTYLRTWSGWVYVAFVLDVYSRMIVGWQIATHMRTDLPLQLKGWRAGYQTRCESYVEERGEPGAARPLPFAGVGLVRVVAVAVRGPGAARHRGRCLRRAHRRWRGPRAPVGACGRMESGDVTYRCSTAVRAV